MSNYPHFFIKKLDSRTGPWVDADPELVQGTKLVLY